MQGHTWQDTYRPHDHVAGLDGRVPRPCVLLLRSNTLGLLQRLLFQPLAQSFRGTGLRGAVLHEGSVRHGAETHRHTQHTGMQAQRQHGEDASEHVPLM